MRLLFSLFLIIALGCSKAQEKDVTKNEPTSQPMVMKPAKVESKEEYIASTTRIGGKKAPIYYKEYFKNPSKFTGHRINLPGTIMMIQENEGTTVLQMQVTGNFDSVIVRYPGSVKVYDGDRIIVYGEGLGTMDGNNAMGAAMTWPVIDAKYIVKKISAE